MQRVMAAKLTRLTHKVAIWQSAISFAVLAPGGKSGNFWIHNRISQLTNHNNSAISYFMLRTLCSWHSTVKQIQNRWNERCWGDDTL